MILYLVHGGSGYGASVWGVYDSIELAEKRVYDLSLPIYHHLRNSREEIFERYEKRKYPWESFESVLSKINKDFPWYNLNNQELLKYCKNSYKIDEITLNENAEIDVYYE